MSKKLNEKLDSLVAENNERVKKVEELRSTDNSFHEDVELLKRMLEI